MLKCVSSVSLSIFVNHSLCFATALHVRVLCVMLCLCSMHQQKKTTSINSVRNRQQATKNQVYPMHNQQSIFYCLLRYEIKAIFKSKVKLTFATMHRIPLTPFLAVRFSSNTQSTIIFFSTIFVCQLPIVPLFFRGFSSKRRHKLTLASKSKKKLECEKSSQ